jgi:hypothetical protein
MFWELKVVGYENKAFDLRTLQKQEFMDQLNKAKYQGIAVEFIN